jgi:hypothetical protein
LTLIKPTNTYIFLEQSADIKAWFFSKLLEAGSIFCKNWYGTVWVDNRFLVKKIQNFKILKIFVTNIYKKTRWIMMNYGEITWWKQAHLTGQKSRKKKWRKNNINHMSLKIISKGHAKILERLNVFTVLFPKFSFPYSYFYNCSQFFV